MPKGVFNLDSARVMAKNQRAVDNWDLIKEAYKGVGVRITVAQDVAKLVDRFQKTIADVRQAVAKLRTKDADDQKVTEEQLKVIRDARAGRAGENAGELSNLGERITAMEAEIHKAQELAQKFA